MQKLVASEKLLPRYDALHRLRTPGRTIVPMTQNAHETRPRGWLTSDKSYPLHPFLLALASVLSLMVSNLKEVSFFHTGCTLAGVLALAAAVYFGVGALRRRLDARTAVIASIWIGGSLFYSSLFGPLNGWIGGDHTMLRALPVAVLVLGLLTAGALYVPYTLANVTNLVLNGIAVVLFATPAWQAVSYEWRHGAARAAYDPDRAAAAMPEIAGTGTPATATTDRPPDIYHFVFDRYTSEAVLKEHYGLDTSSTGRFLEQRGFFVARGAFANYHRTAFSLASTFYMDTLDVLADAPEVPPDNWQAAHMMLRDHRVSRFLKARGYEFLQYGSWWSGTFRNPAADVNRPHGFSEFNLIYLRKTALRPIFAALPDWRFTRRLDWDNAQCQRMAAQLEDIKSTGGRERPAYVFAHILIPHGPYNFATDGRCLTREESRKRGPKQGFVDQVVYANRIIEDLVTHLQSEGRPDPVILIQSDEGPFPARKAGVPWHEQPDEALRIKTAILNAYYFPNGNYGQLSDDITPVNSYRALFNAHFGTAFELLPDRTYVSPSDRRLYEFHDVTERVRKRPPARE